MSLNEFKSKINLLQGFASRLSDEFVPINVQKVIVKVYAKSININLSDKMLDDLLINFS